MSRPTGTVTMLFTDIEGSTRLARALASEWQDVLRSHHEIVGGGIEAAAGFISGTEGDAFFATFIDARAAIAAAIDTQRRLRHHAWPATMAELRVRMGIHTGEVSVVDGEYVGLEVHRAARVGAAAHGGQVLITAEVRREVGDVAVEDLGLHRLKDFPEPARLFHLVVDDDRPASWFPPPRSQDARPTNLPPNDRTLFGRDSEIEAIGGAIRAGGRLVTLTGPGGTGKTSTALAAGRALLGEWAAGVWVVWAEAMSPGDDLITATAVALRVPDPSHGSLLDAVAERLDGVDVVVVLDNLEHLPAAAHDVSEMLERIPTLRVLATSRTPLRLRDERVVPIEPLLIDDAEALLVDRVRAAGGDLDVGDAETRAAVAALNDKLDGLPLALELAAARLRLLTPAQVVGRLGSVLDLESTSPDRPTRHRSLRATLEWSLELLPAPARQLFARLAVFSAAAPLDLIEEVCGIGGLDVLEGAAALIDHSLLRRTPGGLGLVAAIHETATEHLVSSPDADAVRRAHAVAIATRIELVGDAPAFEIDDAVESEAWTATAWARQADDAVHRRLVLGSASRWIYNGRLRPAIEELTAALAREHVPDEERGRLLLERGMATMTGGDRPAGLVDVDTAMPLLANRQGIDRSNDFVVASFVFAAVGDHRRSLAACEEAVAAARAAGRPRTLVRGLVNLAQALIANGQADDAGGVLDEAEAISGDLDHEIAMYRADWFRVTSQTERCLELYVRNIEEGWLEYEPWSLAGIALALGDLGHAEAALEAGVIADASAAARGIDVDGLTQFGESLPEAMARWRADVGSVAAASAEARARATDAADRVSRVVALATTALGAPKP